MKNKIKEIVNKIINWSIVKYYTYKGKKISKTYVIGKTYYNNMKKCYGIYRGNNMFYEQKEVIDNKYGVQFYDTRNVTYTYLQIGLFKLWEQKDIKIDTDSSDIIDGNKLLSEKYG